MLALQLRVVTERISSRVPSFSLCPQAKRASGSESRAPLARRPDSITIKQFHSSWLPALLIISPVNLSPCPQLDAGIATQPIHSQSTPSRNGFFPVRFLDSQPCHAPAHPTRVTAQETRWTGSRCCACTYSVLLRTVLVHTAVHTSASRSAETNSLQANLPLLLAFHGVLYSLDFYQTHQQICFRTKFMTVFDFRDRNRWT